MNNNSSIAYTPLLKYHPKKMLFRYKEYIELEKHITLCKLHNNAIYTHRSEL